MKYISTRGKAPEQNFEQVLLTGLAPDGGLYVPKTLPTFTIEQINNWAGLSYTQLSQEIITPFVGGMISAPQLEQIIEQSYSRFSHRAIAPLRLLSNNEWLMELYHGPTLAFKDFALQLLGALLDYVLRKNNQKVVILGATSGDTGSAALEGCRHSDMVDIFILHPHNRVSDVQRKQMTTIIRDNVHNIAIEGNFDDCQNIVKSAFADQSFLPENRQLVAVNSINWARIMVQIVYYFHASLTLGGPKRQVSFSVPTGNFGDIYAGYVAAKMGLPINQLVIGTNENDSLHRLIANNSYAMAQLKHTSSPSMDIMVPSNFERYLFDLFDRDGAALSKFMSKLGKEELKLTDSQWQKARSIFSSHAVDDAMTCQVIKEVYGNSDLLVDPHTAIGIAAGRQCNEDPAIPMINLATAHPAKFSEAVTRAGLEVPPLPPHLDDLFEREEKYQVLDNNLQSVTNYIQSSL